MYIIVGLGNPGKKFENTRHNMGFHAVDLIAEKYGIRIDRLRFRALTGEGRIGGEKVMLVKPQTFMNLSGGAVREVMSFYKESPEHLIVIYDDIDLDTGYIRIRSSGSAGTHNGMRDIVSQLSCDRFPRIRVGIGSALKGDLVDFVIGGVTKAEVPLLEDSLTKAAEAAAVIVTEGITAAMNKYNVKPKRVRQQKAAEVAGGGADPKSKSRTGRSDARTEASEEGNQAVDESRQNADLDLNSNGEN